MKIVDVITSRLLLIFILILYYYNIRCININFRKIHNNSCQMTIDTPYFSINYNANYVTGRRVFGMISMYFLVAGYYFVWYSYVKT